jgi:hypothetical protein
MRLITITEALVTAILLALLTAGAVLTTHAYRFDFEHNRRRNHRRPHRRDCAGEKTRTVTSAEEHREGLWLGTLEKDPLRCMLLRGTGPLP